MCILGRFSLDHECAYFRRFVPHYVGFVDVVVAHAFLQSVFAEAFCLLVCFMRVDFRLFSLDVSYHVSLRFLLDFPIIKRFHVEVDLEREVSFFN